MNRTLAITMFVATVCSTAAAQTAAPIPPPTPGLLLSYQYWPTQYIQWIVGTELPYGMIEFDVDNSTRQPVYHCVLTGKDGKRTHYSNLDGMVASFKAQGEASYKAAIAYDSDETGTPGSTSTMRFTMADGKPLEWRFVQGSDISAQGSGVTPLPQSPIPIFAYREEGAVAGEGSALKIGDAVSTAEVWKEISKPPYFVGYRGAVTSSAHMLVLIKGTENWTVTSAPTTLAVGNTWQMESDNGNHRTLTIDKTDATHSTINVADKMHPLTRAVMTATRTTEGWTVDSVRYSPVKDGDKHYMTLALTSKTLDITAGKKEKIATASIETEGTATDRTGTVKFTSPAWVAGKQLTEEVTVTPEKIILAAK